MGEATQIFERIANDLYGMKLSNIWQGRGSAILLDFGDLAPNKRLDGSLANVKGEVGIMIERNWRIEDMHSIISASEGDKELWQPIFDSLLGTRVSNLNLFGRLPEIDL